MLPPRLIEQAAELLADLEGRRLKLATAESCTGGLISALLTEIAGSSSVVDRGFVTYSNAAKSEMIGVPAGLIAQYGAVSREVAEAMARGALRHSRAEIAVSVTGLAGPGGGTANKPVGLVHIAAARRGGACLNEEHCYGNIGRSAVRIAAVEDALSLVSQLAATGVTPSGT